MTGKTHYAFNIASAIGIATLFEPNISIPIGLGIVLSSSLPDLDYVFFDMSHIYNHNKSFEDRKTTMYAKSFLSGLTMSTILILLSLFVNLPHNSNIILFLGWILAGLAVFRKRPKLIPFYLYALPLLPLAIISYKDYLKTKGRQHRKITHSLTGLIIFAINMLIIYILSHNQYVFLFSIGSIIGYFLHLLLDYLTPTGVPFFYPFKKKKYSLRLIYNGSQQETNFRTFSLLIASFLTILAVKLQFPTLQQYHWFQDFIHLFQRFSF